MWRPRRAHAELALVALLTPLVDIVQTYMWVWKKRLWVARPCGARAAPPRLRCQPVHLAMAERALSFGMRRAECTPMRCQIQSAGDHVA